MNLTPFSPEVNLTPFVTGPRSSTPFVSMRHGSEPDPVRPLPVSDSCQARRKSTLTPVSPVSDPCFAFPVYCEKASQIIATTTKTAKKIAGATKSSSL